MKQKSGPGKAPAEQVLKDIRRQTRRQYSAEEKIRNACAEPVLQISIKARFMTRSMRKFEGHVVEIILAFERIERRHRDKILAGHIVRFAVDLADVGSRGEQTIRRQARRARQDCGPASAFLY
jgi:hypothetical protein